MLVKGDTLPVFLDPSLRLSGWSGGQGLQWAVPLAEGELTVKSSTGFASGFMLWGSSETGDQHTTLTQSQIYYRVGTMCLGGWFIDTTTFERYTYASRQAGPLVPLVYQREDRLLFGLSGLFTREDEWSLSGDPRAPNTFFSGTVIQPPASDGYMLIQTST